MSNEAPVLLLPMLQVPMKQTKSVNFSPPLNEYIMTHYGEEPSKYSSAVEYFNQLRSDVEGVGFDAVGRDLLYKYYGQLELLELHFPLGGEVKVEFSWSDSFSEKWTTQTALAFEKASVIFNLGSLASNIAASQSSRATESGLKTACNYFECAAGIFRFVSDNFLHAPSTDMSKEFLSVLHTVMLAQAQECFVDKAISDKKKSSIIIKLASQAAHLYQTALDGLVDSGSLPSSYCPRFWVNIVKIKSKYFDSLANYHRALVAETEAKYGEQVARCMLADTLAKECVKIAKDSSGITDIAQFLGIGSADGSKSDTIAATKTLADQMKTFSTFIAQRLQQFNKDNDIIYHASIPASATLQPLDKMSLANPKKLTELFPQLANSIGEDLFKSLIPLDVAEKSSIYSEEKSKMIREQSDKVTEADGELQATIASMNVRETLAKLEPIQINSSSQNLIPSEVFQWADYIRLSEGKEPIWMIFKRIGDKRMQIVGYLKQIESLLEQDRVEWNSVHSVNPGFMQPGPETAGESIRRDVDAQHNNLAMGLKGDEQLSLKLQGVDQNVKLLCTADIRNLYSSSSKLSNGTASLLDTAVNTEQEGPALIKTVKDIMQKLFNLQKERQTVLNDLRKKVQDEDINQLLILNKSNEEAVFKVEMDKFLVYKDRMKTNITQQTKELDQLREQFSILMRSDFVKKTQNQIESSEKLTMQLREARIAYEEVRNNISTQGLKFYEGVESVCLQLLDRTKRMLGTRQAERSQFAGGQAVSQTEILQKRLSALQMNTQPPPQNPRF